MQVYISNDEKFDSITTIMDEKLHKQVVLA